jgi:hypothetical protein
MAPADLRHTADGRMCADETRPQPQALRVDEDVET